MNSWWYLLAVVVLAAPVLGQTQVLEDQEEDAEVSAGGAAELPPGVYNVDDFDLVSFWVTERPDGFDFTLKVRNLEKEVQTELDNAVYSVDFQHADTTFRLRFVHQVLLGSDAYAGDVMVWDAGRQTFVPMQRVQLDVSPSSGEMTMFVERDLLLDGNGTAPTLGREFSLFRAFSRASLIFDGPFGGGTVFRVEDAMPDSGFGDIPYAIQQGLKQTGHARLWSDNPVRASNGEQATFVYYVDAENLNENQDRFDLSVSGVPAGWQVTLPAPTIRIDGNDTQPFPVLVSTPFAHQHGAFESLVLKMTSHRDRNAVGQIQLGIRYLEIPQPAGHHDRVWIHARPSTAPQFFFDDALQPGGDSVAYMSAIEDDPRRGDLEVAPDNLFICCSFGQERIYTWDVWLEPSLQLGLDFDINNTGTIEVEFTSDVPINDVTVSGQLIHFGESSTNFGQTSGSDGTLLGSFAPTAPIQLNGPQKFETIFTPTREADLIEYSPGAGLMLQLSMSATAVEAYPAEQLVPRLLPTGVMRLPLFEYRDPVEDVFNSLAGISMKHSGAREKFVNPGEVVLFNLTLTNEGAVDDVFQLRVNGTNEGWARILGDKTVFVPTGTSRPLVVAVVVPKEAIDGDVVDLIVTAASEAEPTTQGNARIVAVVDEVVDRTDESHLVPEIEKELTKGKDSPAVGFIGLLAALVIGLRRRR